MTQTSSQHAGKAVSEWTVPLEFDRLAGTDLNIKKTNLVTKKKPA